MLLPDFLEDVSIQYLKSVLLFSKRFKLWLLGALEGFPAILQISKLKGRFAHKARIQHGGDECCHLAALSSGWSVVHCITLCSLSMKESRAGPALSLVLLMGSWAEPHPENGLGVSFSVAAK